MSLVLSGDVAKRLIELSEALGVTPSEYVKMLLDRASLGRRVDLMPLRFKVKVAEIVAEAALEVFSKPLVVWSGGKDSTVTLHIVRRVAEGLGKSFDVVFIDHYMHFEETLDFVRKVVSEWGLRLFIKGNERLRGFRYGDVVKVDELDPRDRDELLKIGYGKPEFTFSLNNIAANHLLKTVPLLEFIRDGGYDGVFVGIRWDENPARASEVFFSRRSDPVHIRVHPILHFTERDIWDYTLSNKLPINPLYYRGYRSIDDKYETKPTGNKPAWEQDLERTPERVGRAQDKEGIMELLRRYGYM
ncbi:phosphoadenosine phosphosulfate reductase family protein [Vulcanisaeta thermophila]|uniref:phosphoadenosine phosphosulfate reductase family protein n=1 Tax=Vulcanisaeta thermophila TaxID=867917 RepID=UPI000B07DC0E|nr:phosphoadenosine phosphosulfate reductase family protein [Vulcanisaeta thermophila]